MGKNKKATRTSKNAEVVMRYREGLPTAMPQVAVLARLSRR